MHEYLYIHKVVFQILIISCNSTVDSGTGAGGGGMGITIEGKEDLPAGYDSMLAKEGMSWFLSDLIFPNNSTIIQF